LVIGFLCFGVGFASAAPASKQPTDPFFPHSGNFGYDVKHYDVTLRYEPPTGMLTARDEIEARATSKLSEFSLDLVGLKVTSVSVDGEPARYTRGKQKVNVIPAKPVAKGNGFSVEVDYQGVPRKVVDPDGSIEGWYRTGDGAVGVGEPIGTAAWLACNNALRDKATFEIQVTVPAGAKAVSNGVLVSREETGGRATFTWSEAAPMEPYLALVDIGRGELIEGRAGSTPTWTLIDPQRLEEAQKDLKMLPEVIAWESAIFGPYPFAAAGSAIDVAHLGYALESQTRPIYGYAPDRNEVVHETAHQWFGDSVSLERWSEMWLNEGFATWTEWFYAERHGGKSAQEVFEKLDGIPASNTEFWTPAPMRIAGPASLFAGPTYLRGAMTLQALRDKVGTETFLRILRSWAGRHRHGHGDTDQFIALAERLSGRRLGAFFDAWLFEPGKP